MDDARDVAKDGQEDVDEEVSTTAPVCDVRISDRYAEGEHDADGSLPLKEDADRGNEDGEDDLDDVAVWGVSSFARVGPKLEHETYEPVKAMLTVGLVGSKNLESF